RCMGIPKTIDNDLAGTDHCPGFASAAKYIATSVMEVYHDSRVYDTGMITVLECMGRHAGWLTAAAALAGVAGNGPDLIYVPEIDFDIDAFTAKVKEIYAKNKKCFVVVSEGIHDKDGTFIAEYANKNMAKDSFGHAQLGGTALYLANYIKEQTGAKVRGIELSLLQRCAAHCASQTDIDESFASGKAAVENAVAGVTDRMVGFERSYDEKGNYVCNIKLFPLTIVANTEKKLPLEWINETGDGIKQGFIDYALPLIQGETKLVKENGLPRFVHLKKVKAEV
ncbi:MAG: diphosphate--fructose-6-phosphate 1-phosphotransferase, partial [Clostridia bacterium]|nr:diphosphate--fructose-6-phosphate 1-phosphotransferase [Clostridia bacterium]